MASITAGVLSRVSSLYAAAVCYCALLCATVLLCAHCVHGRSYKQDLTVEEKELMKELIKKQQHPQITPEIRCVISSACVLITAVIVTWAMIADNLFCHLRLAICGHKF